MRIILFFILTALSVSCGERPGNTNERDAGKKTEDNYSNETLNADTTRVEIDTTASPGVNRQ